MVVGIRNRTSEPLLIREMVMIEQASWPDPGLVGFFVRERPTDSCPHGCDTSGCPSYEASVVAPGATVYTLHQYDGQLPVSEGAMMDVTVAVTLSWLFCQRAERVVRRSISLRVDNALAARFGLPTEGPTTDRTGMGATTRSTVGAGPGAYASAYQLPGGMVVLVGVLNQTDAPLRLLPDQIINGIAVNGRLIWGSDWPSSHEPPQVECQQWQTVVVEPGAVHWIVRYLPEESYAPGAAVKLGLSMGLGSPYCEAPSYSIRRTTPLTIRASDELPVDLAMAERSPGAP